jgi:hypothetical protein
MVDLETRTGVAKRQAWSSLPVKEAQEPGMTTLDDFSAFAASRGEGLHPKLRELFERTMTVPFSEVTVRTDGMLQAGPDPRSREVGAQDVEV